MFQGGNYRRRRRMKRPFRTLPSLSTRTAAAYITHAAAGAANPASIHAQNPNSAFIHNPYGTPLPASPTAKHRYPGSAAAFNFVHPNFAPHVNVTTGSSFGSHPQFAATAASAMSSHPGFNGFHPSAAKGIAGVYDAAASSFSTFTAMLSQNGFHPSVNSAAAAAMYQNPAGYFQVGPNSPTGLPQKVYYPGVGSTGSNPTAAAAYYPSMNKYVDETFNNASGYNQFYSNSYANSTAANFMHNSALSPSLCVKQE